MKILFLHNEYGAVSGEEHALRAIADLLVTNGHRVDWFLRSSADIQGLGGKTRAFFSGIHSLRAVSDLEAFLRRQPVDAALVQNLYPFLSPSILPLFKKFGIPVLMRCPNYRLFCPTGLHLSHGEVCERCLGGREYWCVIRNCENSLFKSMGYALRNTAARLTRRIVDNVSLFIVLSEFQKRRFVAGGVPPERLEILPNIAPVNEKSSSNDQGVLVSFVGRVSPEKGIADFVSAAVRMPEIPFAVAGGLDRMPDLPKRSPRNIRWLGFLSGNALDDFYRQSRILVFPGKWFEGFPNVITQAMMAEKPVVASRMGSIPEIVDHGRTGLLFQPGNIAELTAHIQRLYADPAKCLSMGSAGRFKAEIYYSRQAVYARLMEIIDRVCGTASATYTETPPIVALDTRTRFPVRGERQ